MKKSILFIEGDFIKFIPYGKQFISQEDINCVVDVLKSDFITQGPKIEEFEKALADYCNAKHAVIFNSGTSALHASYYAYGISKNDEIITTPNTFVATSNAALYLGGKPNFVDIKLETGNIDENKIEEQITEKTKLIAPVHYSGNPVDLEIIHEIAEKHGLGVIEDAAHALGAEYNGKKIGNCEFSDMVEFSFHPVKHITTGEGGAVVTNNDEYYEKLINFRSHGITKYNLVNENPGPWYYEMQDLGFNYRITDIQAALGLSQLKKIDKFVERRREIAKIYNEIFNGNPYFDCIIENKNALSAYHLFPIILKDEFKNKKSLIFNKLRESKLGVQTHYIPVHTQPYYTNLGYNKNDCPISKDFYEKEISIPMFPSMTDEDISLVVKRLFNVLENI